MGHDRKRGLKPAVEHMEPRALLSAIIDLMAEQGSPLHASNAAAAQASSGLVNPNVNPPGGPGPGSPTPRELARERFKAYFSGPVYFAPPRFTGQKSLIEYRGLGGSTQFLHGDYQMEIIIPNNPSSSIVGLAYLQDRNINSGGAMGLDVTLDPNSLDKLGRPTKGTFIQDANIYSGVDFVFTASGTVSIRYAHGEATVTFQGLLYTNGVTNPLRNMDLQARGGRPHSHL